MSFNEPVPCQHCAGPTTFTTELSPLGSEPGHRVSFCATCNRYTWTTWTGWNARRDQTPRPVQPQQQQQQQQPAKPEPDESK
jgi:hypothetical protein